MPSNPGDVLRQARLTASLSQRRLAELAGTSQPVVARIESSVVSPGVDTLTRLLAAAGFELELAARPVGASDSHMMEDVDRILSLSPRERLVELRNASRFFSVAERV